MTPGRKHPTRPGTDVELEIRKVDAVSVEAQQADNGRADAVEIEDGVETDLAVISGSPDPSDMAAITAVLAGVLDELAAEQGRRESAAPSAWARSQRDLRTTLRPGAGAWRSFSG